VNCGGGLCCAEIEPTCCPPTTQDPGGFCTLEGETCCTSEEGGGTCPEEFPECCLVSLGAGCCEKDVPCSNITADCPQGSGLECDDFGCCVPNTGIQSRATRSHRKTRRRHLH
jgi:hypothetical protein